MSRIVIAIFGSLGDLHPKIAIARELQRCGHQIVFATWEDYRDRLENLGFEFHPMRPQGLDLEDPEAIAMIMDLKKGTERLLKDYIFAHLRETYLNLALFSPLLASRSLGTVGDFAGGLSATIQCRDSN